MKSSFSYIGIRVTDLQKAIDFYVKLLGMTVIGRGSIEQTKGETVGWTFLSRSISAFLSSLPARTTTDVVPYPTS